MFDSSLRFFNLAVGMSPMAESQVRPMPFPCIASPNKLISPFIPAILGTRPGYNHTSTTNVHLHSAGSYC